MSESKYKPEYCQLVIDHMKKGKSFETFGNLVDVHKDTLYEWAKKHPEFKEAKKKAFLQAQGYFEDKLTRKLNGDGDRNAKSIDTSLLIFALKTRFHETYGEKAKEETKELKVTFTDERASKL